MSVPDNIFIWLIPKNFPYVPELCAQYRSTQYLDYQSP